MNIRSLGLFVASAAVLTSLNANANARPPAEDFIGTYGLQCQSAQLEVSWSEGTVELPCQADMGVAQQVAADYQEVCLSHKEGYEDDQIPGVSKAEWDAFLDDVCENVEDGVESVMHDWISTVNGEFEITGLENAWWFFYNGESKYTWAYVDENGNPEYEEDGTPKVGSFDWGFYMSNNYSNAGITFDPLYDVLPFAVILPGDSGFACNLLLERTGGGNITRSTMIMDNGHAELGINLSCTGDLEFSHSLDLDVQFSLEKN